MNFDWKKAVRAVAPALGTALGGPIPAVALKYIADTVLGDSEATPQQAEQQLEAAIASGDPEILLKLKQADHGFTLKLEELGIKKYALEVEDRKSARSLFQINIWPQIILAAAFNLGYFGVLFALFFGAASVNPEMKTEASMIIGVLTAGVVKILDFWYGSSYGSKEKTALQYAKGGPNA